MPLHPTIASTAALLALAGAPLLAQAPARPAAPPAAPPSPPAVITAVVVNLTVKPGIDRALVTRTMPEEVRETVQLYLKGKIQQWYAREDGHGVMFIMNASSVAEAKALMETLPLAKAGYADLAYMGLEPLTPLRYLLGPAAGGAPAQKP